MALYSLEHAPWTPSAATKLFGENFEIADHEDQDISCLCLCVLQVLGNFLVWVVHAVKMKQREDRDMSLSQYLDCFPYFQRRQFLGKRLVVSRCIYEWHLTLGHQFHKKSFLGLSKRQAAQNLLCLLFAEPIVFLMQALDLIQETRVHQQFTRGKTVALELKLPRTKKLKKTKDEEDHVPSCCFLEQNLKDIQDKVYSQHNQPNE